MSRLLLPRPWLLAVLAAAVAAAAAPAAGAQPPPLGERDWMLPSEVAPSGGGVRSIAAEAGVGAPCPTCPEPAVYRSFVGVDHEVVRFTGRHVELMVPAAWLDLFTSDELLTLVDVADRTYELLHQLVGREPGGADRRLSVAYVEPSCGIACGLVGHKGLEIWPGDMEDGSYDPTYLDSWRQLSAASVPHDILLHEMTHNFDVYASHLHYHADSAHFWTDLVNIWGFVYGMMEGDLAVGHGTMSWKQWFERERAWVEATTLPYLNHPGRSWQSCVRDNACESVLPKRARASLALALFEQAGPLAAKRTMEFLRQWQAATPQPPATPEAREELWLEALAAGIGADIGACLDAFSWHNPPSLAPRLAQHGPPAAFCQDGDGDGTIALLGDCHDGDPAIGPGRPELPNGVDDDCNGVVDEALPASPTPSRNFNNPKQISAPPVAVDVDVAEGFGYLGFRVPSAGRLLTRACSPSGGYRGFLWLAGSSPPVARGAFVERGGCSTFYLPADSASDWRLTLEAILDFGDEPGPVRLAIGPAAPWPGPWGGVGIVPKPGGGFELSATIADASAFRQPADRVLFQVSGYGEVGWGSLAGGATASVQWPGDPVDGKHFVYAQPYAGEVPAGPPLRAAFDPSLLAPCEPGPETACLLGGRFEVRGTMSDFESPPNTLPVRVMEFPGGRAESSQAAFFESFQPGNFEIGVKMVDGCGLPEGSPLHSYWLFVGGLTSADSLVRVEDTATGAVFEWNNPPGNLPTTFGETGVFACGGTPVPGACVAGDETACLLGRFLVSGTMKDFETPPNTLPVRVMSFPGSRAESDQAAFFESFQPGNFEVGVKMVDACALPPGSPGRAYWLFAGGLTSARTDLTIRQVATGQVVDWVNPSGSLPTSTGDTAAFACP
jgi:hypothetical protein